MEQSLTVVGIGASAGGLEALQVFFKAVAEKTQYVFVVIQHLSSDYESMMDELLARHTSMPIQVVDEPMTMHPNHVYLISRKHNLIIDGQQLKPVPKEEKPQLNLPIDTFFRSLGNQCQDRTIAIILSGSGSDGSRGIKDIKECGGIVMVQAPETAKFEGMPQAALASGLADYRLSVPEIAQEINRLASKGSKGLPQDLESLSDEDMLRTVLSLVHDKTGTDFQQHRTPTLVRRIDKRRKIVGSDSVQDYFRYLSSHEGEIKALAEEFSIAVSGFFRDKHVWNIFASQVIPDLFARKQEGEPLRVWVPGCSTGEEAYTLAILLSEYQQHHRAADFKIFASDIDKTSLAKAGQGEYATSIMHDLDAAFLEKYFKRTDHGYKVSKALRDKVVFAVHNVINDPPFIRMDVVSCRNLLIYIKPKAQQTIFNKFHFSLHYQGYLILGTSETASTQHKVFEAIAPHTHIFRNIQKEKSKQFSSSSFTPQTSRTIPRHQSSESTNGHAPDEAASDYYATILVREHAPASVFVDPENYDILYIHGNIGTFLGFPQKQAQLNMLQMLGKEEQRLIKNGVQKAQQQKVSVLYENMRFHRDQDQSVDLRFKEVWHESLRQQVVLIEFKSGTAEKVSDGFSVEKDQVVREQINMLEQEVQEKNHQLQSLTEELETSNEELQASNEELQASNEELQSTNEELQSVNEELYSVNAELKEKVEELVSSNNDIDNLFNSTDVGTIFLDREMNIRKATLPVKRIINIDAKDTGRPLTNFSTQLKQNHLPQDIKKVLEQQQPVRREVETKAGDYYLNQVLPYQKADGTTEGVLITFVDITDTKKARAARKKAEKETAEANDYLEMVIESAKVGIWVWDIKTDTVVWNQHMKDLFDFPNDTFDNRFSTAVDRVHPDDVEPLNEAIRATLYEREKLDVEYRVVCQDEGIHYINSQGNAVYNRQGKPVSMIGTCVDLTKRKQAEEAALQYGQLLERSHNEIYIINAKTLRFINVNQGGKENMGYSLREMQQLTLLEITPDLSRQQFHHLVEPLEAGEKESIQYETVHQRKDGTQYNVLCSLQYTQYQSQDAFVSIVQDITEKAISNAQLKETNHQLKIANEYLDNFVFTAAHDLRAPVANLKSLVDLLQRPTPLDTRVVEKIDISVDRLESTLSGLIKILDIQQYDHKTAEELNFEETYQRIYPEFEQAVQTAQATVETLFEVKTICYTEPYLTSIMRNLLSNAVRYRSELRPLHIRISTQAVDGYVSLRVQDNGVGIDLNRFEKKLFKPFTRLTQQGEGQGIGLHLVKTMVERNNGYLTVESQPQEGTIFKAYLKPYDNDE